MLPFEKEKENAEILVRQEADTSPEYGCPPEQRPVKDILNYGIVNIDKPAGPSSHQVSAYVKQMLGISKAGHSGTLDPAVTGVLPVALGNGTRITHPLLSAGKEYVCLMHLHSGAGKEKVTGVFEEFKGEISQLPPVRSAVKRRQRKRTIYYIDVLDIDGQDVLFRAGTQAGTYIRKLCHDIGERLGTGAHMSELRRTQAGPFKENTLVTLQELADAFHLWKEEGDETHIRKAIQPVEKGIDHLPKIWVLDTTVDSLCHGATLKMPGVSRFTSNIEPKSMVAVLTLKGELVMTAVSRSNSSQILKSERGVAVKPKQVFMEPGTYPRVK